MNQRWWIVRSVIGNRVGLLKNQFKAATYEELLAAFKLLDPENKGYIKEDEMKNLLMNCGYLLATIGG